MSPDQLKLYWANLNAVLKQRADLDRASFHAQHNLPASTKDFTKAHMDAFLAACAAILQPANLKPQLRAFDQPKSRLLYKINDRQGALLKALGVADPVSYIASVSKDKFHGRLPADLVGPVDDSFHANPGAYSELEKLHFTISNRIKELRNQRGWTEHQLMHEAGQGKYCRCAACHRENSRMRRFQTPRAPGQPVEDNVPF